MIQKRIDENILISVLIPVYNVEKYLRETLVSVMTQGLKDIEIIAVDNKSTDGSLDILREIAEKESRLRVIALPENGGVRASRGAALEAACGKYVYFLDADDILEPDILAQAFEAAESGHCDVLQFGHREFRDNDGEIFRTSLPNPKCVGADIRANPAILHLQTKYIWDKLFRHRFLIDNDIHIPVYNYMEDHYFLFSVAMKAKNFGILPVYGYRYRRMVANARTRSYTDELLDCSKAYWDIVETTRRAGMFKELAPSIWRNASECYRWRVLAFANYDDKVLQGKIIKDWFDFFQANFPCWQKNLHLAGIPCHLPPDQPKKVLLLGGTGALGAHLRDILADAGCQVFVTSRKNHLDKGNIVYLTGNAMDPAFFNRLMASRWDVIVDFMIYGPDMFRQRLDVLLKMSGQYVFLSSSRVYADSGMTPITEDSPRILDTVKDDAYLKTNEYALAKGRAEDILKSHERNNWTIIRPYVTFSEERLQLGTLEKENWLKRALAGKPIVFSEDIAERTTTLTYGHDVARGMAAIIGETSALGQTYHITSSTQVKWRDVLDMYVRVIEDVTGKPCPVVMTHESCQLRTGGRYQVLFDRHYNRVFDNSKIGGFIDVSTFREPMAALEECLRIFLKKPDFLPENAELTTLHDAACGQSLLPGGGKRGYTVERNVQILIAALKAHGIRQVIASPGTTNLTFVASLEIDPFFTLYSAPDERSAAYMACGLAAESGAPVVITCTGATASRNYLPGLTEAYYRKLPVLAVTGTLYENRSGHLTAQFVDRSSVPSDAARLSVSMPSVRAKDDEWHNVVAANRAILELTRHGGGPVHINLETGHSLDYSVEKLPPVRCIRRHFRGGALPEMPKGRVAVFVGSHLPWDDGLRNAVERFCERFDAVVFCDHTSNYRGVNGANFALACYQQSKSFTAYHPDVMIHIGEITGDYPSMQICGPAKVWRVSPDGEIRDTFRRLTDVFEMDERSFFEWYSEHGERRRFHYRKQCRSHAENLLHKVPELPFSNLWVASRGCGSVPDGSILHFGILNSFRSWSLWPLPKSVLASCNTGGFGIDGGLSTVLGASLAQPDKLHFIVIGDLAFFYDMNSLGNRHVGGNLRILLVNNAKGVEFRNFNHPASRFGASADRHVAAGGHYGAGSKSLVRHYAEDLGFEYLSASSKEEYECVEKRFWNSTVSSCPMILEVFTSGVDDSDALQAMTLLEGAPVRETPIPTKSAAASSRLVEVAPASGKKFSRKVARSRKIAVLTFHAAFNYGAQLQAWALQTVLRRLGYDPEFPDCNLIGFSPRFLRGRHGKLPFLKKLFREAMAFGVEDLKRHRFRMFAKHCLNIVPMDVADVERRYDSVIVGSDQVWNSGITRQQSSYFLTTWFYRPDLNRYSYALSVGDKKPTLERENVLAKAARKFQNLSVREDLFMNMTDCYGRAPVVDPDPTFLLDANDFNAIAYPQKMVDKPYLLVYSLMYNERTWAAAREMARRMNLKLVILQCYQYGWWGHPDRKDVHLASSPDRFLAYFRDASAVITSSFHGTAFSLIYGKPFAVLPNHDGKVPARSALLLKKLNESSHAVDCPDRMDMVEEALSKAPAARTMETIARLRSTTVKRLRETLPDVSSLPPLPVAPAISGKRRILRKIRGGIRCLNENGLSYTVKHLVGKTLRFCGVRSRL